MADQPVGGGAAGEQRAASVEGPESNNKKDPSWEYKLRKYLLLLATLVATVTYGAAFNPPGGVWQDADRAIGRIAGDPIIRETSYPRYLAFFYSNATAFASSLVVIVLVLILSILHERKSANLAPLRILRVVMVLDLFSLMAAYAAGTFRDRLTAIYSIILLAGVVFYLAVHTLLASVPEPGDGAAMLKRAVAKLRKLLTWLDELTSPAGKKEMADTAVAKLRKNLMLLATFAVSVTYVAGLSAPGGFWDNDEHGHHPGRAILKGGAHDTRLKVFFVFNTTAFVASLLIIIILLDKKLSFSRNMKAYELYGLIAFTLLGLVGAYSAGSCRQVDTTVYVNSLLGAVIVFILAQAAVVMSCQEAITNSCLWSIPRKVSGWLSPRKPSCFKQSNANDDSGQEQRNQVIEKASSFVLLLATLAAAITYQAGLNPPGGLWQADDDSGGNHYMAGDPILLTTEPRRYKAFYYCNSTAFVASLVAIVLVRMKTLHDHNALEAAMILDLLGLVGAYAAGSCREVSTSIYAVGLAGVVLFYVVIHVVFIYRTDNTTKVRGEEDDLLEKRRKRLLIFAILAATITYQAGLTPPSGFLIKDDHDTGRLAGDPVLLNNYPRRYTAFFYCNSVSFMLSIALIILLVNPNIYKPAIRSNALSVCTAVGMIGIMGAYAAGCTQHLKTSIYIFTLAAFVLFLVVMAVLFLAIDEKWRKDRAKKKKSNPAVGAESPPNGRATGDIEAATEAGDATTGGGGAEIELEDKTEAGESPPEGRGTDIEAPMESGNDATTEVVDNRAESPVAEDTPKTEGEVEDKLRAKRKYLMLLGILAASITYQAGLAPPGGVWQDDGGRYTAGDPVMHDNRRHRYLAFFYSNSTSFVASVVVIVLLLPPSLNKKWWFPWWLGVMNTTIVLDLLGLLIAYAAGSNRSWKTAGYVSALVIAVLAYFVIHVTLSCSVRRRKGDSSGHSDQQIQVANGHARAP